MVELGALALKLLEPALKAIGGRLYDRYLQYKIRRDIRLGTGKKIGIIVTRLTGDDGANSHRATLYETIRRELGTAIELTNWPEEFALKDGYESDIQEAVYGKAQKLLKDRNCDLLISGRVKGQGSSGTVLSLRFTVAQARDGNPESYNLTKTFDLPVKFIGDLGAAIAARVVISAAPAAHMAGQYLVPMMQAAAERLEPLTGNLNRKFDADTRGSLLFSHAVVQFIIGEQAGSNAALLQSIKSYRAALLDWTRERWALAWAMTQNNLGNALTALGQRENGTQRLEEAVEAYRAALLEYMRERLPLDWAMTQNNLGNVLQAIGERESGIERLQETVEAFRAALLERTRERVPLQWATTQNNLGNTLQTLGERESGTERLLEAVEAHRTALLEFTRPRVPLQWAATQNNLGNALARLGERESGTERLRQAVAAYREALLEWTRDRVPLDWAMTQNNLGNALQALGARESGTEQLRQAVDAYRAALLEFTRQRVPLQWATTQNNLGNALATVGKRENSPEWLFEAVEVYRAALLEWTREHVPVQWAMAQNNLGNALFTLGERETGTERLQDAVAAFRAAREVFEEAKASYYIEGTRRDLARAEALLAERQSKQ